mmetsp:Transcript_14447/g.22287  ORF Transcript_14447/g.22287 Transcript_14447/m.22287 type:complete len:127 (-) Transcript_14447:315-695(-)
MLGARWAGGQSNGGKATKPGKGKEQRNAKEASDAKPNAKEKEHSTAWTKHVAKNNDALTGKKGCKQDIWSNLHGWERRHLINEGQHLRKSEWKAERDQQQADMELMKKSKLELKRKLEQRHCGFIC